VLDEADFNNCVDSQKMLIKSEDPNFEEKVMRILYETRKKINLTDYVFVRRINLAWNKCSIDNDLSRLNLDCALAIVSPARRMLYMQTNEIFDLAIKLNFFRNKQVAYLDFLTLF